MNNLVETCPPAKIQREVERQYRQFHNPTLSRLLKLSGYGTVEHHALGSYVYNLQGEGFLDFAGGYGVFSLGHRHPRIISAVKDQLDQMPLSAKVFFNGVLAELCRELARIAPGELTFSFLCNSGAEAVEGAIKTARLATGKSKIIAACNSFHGKTLGALSASGRDLFKEGFHPLLPRMEQVPFGDMSAMEQAMDDDTAAVLLEPIQGEGGIMLPPDDYLGGVRRLCTKKGILLIADEVQTGLGRTGKMFAMEHWNVSPDMMCLAKALGGGVMPVGAFMGTPRVWEAFRQNPTIHTSTFGGGEMACRAALETIRVIEDEGLVENSGVMGKYLMDGLLKLAGRYEDLIAQVRGKGLMIGMEMTQEKFGGSLIMEMAKRRVIAVYTLNKPRVIRFEPPLNVKSQEIDLCLSALEESLEQTRQRFE